MESSGLTDWLTDGRTSSNSIAMGMVGKKDIDYQWVKMNQWVKKGSKKKLGSINKGCDKGCDKDFSKKTIASLEKN